MSEHSDTRDELVSAVLDGEATAAEVAAVRNDPALAARLDELASVRAQLRAEPAPPSGAADAAIAAALEAASPPGIAPVVTHSRWRRAAPALAAAAAVLVALFGILALTRSTPSNKTSSTAAGALAADTSTSTTLSGATVAEAAAVEQLRAADSGTADFSVALGSFTDTAVLVDAAKQAASPRTTSQTAAAPDGASPAASPSTTPPAARAPFACVPPRGGTSLVLTSTAELNGEMVLVFVYEEGQGLAVIAIDAATCAPVFTVTP